MTNYIYKHANQHGKINTNNAMFQIILNDGLRLSIASKFIHYMGNIYEHQPGAGQWTCCIPPIKELKHGYYRVEKIKEKFTTRHGIEFSKSISLIGGPPSKPFNKFDLMDLGIEEDIKKETKLEYNYFQTSYRGKGYVIIELMIIDNNIKTVLFNHTFSLSESKNTLEETLYYKQCCEKIVDVFNKSQEKKNE